MEAPLRERTTQQALLASALLIIALLIVDALLFSLPQMVVILLSGLYQGMLFFLVAAGLSIVFGLMDVLNLAQGAFFMMGAYSGFAVYNALPAWSVTPRFVAALLAATLVGAGLGALTERAFIRPLYARPIFQIVLTLGLGMVAYEAVRAVYGPAGLIPITPPAALDTTVVILGAQFETYRLFIIGMGAAIMALTLVLLRRTRLGIIIRAGVENREMVEALGIPIARVFTGVFAFGCAIAALGGMTAAPYIGAYPSMGDVFLLNAIIVVVLGGMGSFEGTTIASLLVGLARASAEQISLEYLGTPLLASVSILLIMVLVLLIRPAGLFGRTEE